MADFYLECEPVDLSAEVSVLGPEPEPPSLSAWTKLVLSHAASRRGITQFELMLKILEAVGEDPIMIGVMLMDSEFDAEGRNLDEIG